MSFNKSLSNRAQRRLKAMSAENNELPHEFLLRITRGEPINQRRLVVKYHEFGPDAGKVMSKEWVEEPYYPDFQTRVAAAKSAAPYYAPRLASQTIDTGKDITQTLTDLLYDLSDKLPN